MKKSERKLEIKREIKKNGNVMFEKKNGESKEIEQNDTKYTNKLRCAYEV